MSDSEEHSEDGKESISLNFTNDDDSESSREDGGDSLNIKPPQATTKSRERHHADRRSRHSRRHDSQRRDRLDRRSDRDNRPSKSEDSRRQPRKNDSRPSHSRHESAAKERDSHKMSSAVRDVRSKRDTRDTRDRRGDSKSKDEKRTPAEKNISGGKIEEWRKKRLLFIEKQKEKDRKSDNRSHLSKGDNQSGSQDLREKLREKERMQQERKRRLERFRSPPKSQSETQSEKKEKQKPITPERKAQNIPKCYAEEAMEYEENKERSEEETDQSSDEKQTDIADTESDSESSASDTESSSHNSKTADEEEPSEEETAEAPQKPKEEEVKVPSPAKPSPSTPSELLIYLPAIQGCRSVEEFNCLNKIEEGTYGVVYRAKEKKTGEIVALKRIKMEKEKNGFPITSLREINTLLKAQHPHIVTSREIVVGSNMDKIYIVMDYVEHDLKSLMGTMKQPFLIGEVKTLMSQLLNAVAHLHDNWILHRDLKTSNLLLSHKGILKVGDFGLAREYGSPLKNYTPIVVTLWYRAPELLLGAEQYSTPIDIWSVGCIFAELLTMKPLFPGTSEVDEINRIFKDLGTPSEKIWPGYNELPAVKKMKFIDYPYNTLRSRFGNNFTDLGFDLLNRLLTYNPARRITAEEAEIHDYFKEKPLPVNPSMFPTYPAKSEQIHRKISSPKPPSGGKQYALELREADDESLRFHMADAREGTSSKGSGFSLKF